MSVEVLSVEVLGVERTIRGVAVRWPGKAFAVALFAIFLALPTRAFAQPDFAFPSSDRIDFNIPSQPLAKALAAFGEAAGFEIIADGRQASGRVSAPVAGTMSAAEALRTLVAGTGLMVRAYGPGNVKLVAASAPIVEPEFSPATSLHAFYYAAVQDMVLQTICHIDAGAPADHQLAIMLWLAPSGAVTRARLLDTSGERQRDASFSDALERVGVGAPLPSGLKQPITLIVRPQSRLGSDCADTRFERRRASN